MNLLFHLIQKDLRYAGKWLGLTWAVWALVAFHPFFTSTMSIGEKARLLPVLVAVGWIIALLTQTRIIHLDPLIASTRFLATRPLHRGTEIGAKLALVFLGIILPIVSFKTLMIAFYALDLSVKDYLLLGLSEFVFVTTISFITLLPAVFSRKLSTTILIIVSAVVVLWLFVAFTQWDGFNLMMGVSIDDEIDLNTSRRFVLQIALIVFSCWAVLGFTVTRRWVQPTLALLFVIIAGATAYFWNINFVRALSSPPPQAPREEWPDLSSARGFFTDKVFFDHDLLAKPLLVIATSEGVPEPWYLREMSYQSMATFSDGSTLSRTSPSYASFGFNFLQHQAMVRKKLGGAYPQKPTGHGEKAEVEIFRNFPKEEKELVALSGTVRFQARRALVLGTLPVQVGASVLTQRARYTISGVFPKDDRIEVLLSTEAFWLTLSGNMPGRFTGEVVMLAVDETSKEWLDLKNSGVSRTFIGNLSLDETRLSIWLPAHRLSGKTKPADVKLLLIGSEAGGEITIPFRRSAGAP